MTNQNTGLTRYFVSDQSKFKNLSGENGSNRSTLSSLIPANDDRTAIELFLKEYEHSQSTLSNYRKEIERLLLWSLLKKAKALSDLNLSDLQSYEAFLLSPDEDWTGPRQSKFLKNNQPNLLWRPLVGPLKPQSVQLTLSIINSFFCWLTDAQYLQHNPLKLMRKRQSRQAHILPNVERYLTLTQWNAVEQILHESIKNQHNIRLKFLCYLLYYTGIRVSECIQITLKDIKQIREKWWLDIIGKGNKRGLIPINQVLLSEIQDYRHYFNCPPLATSDNMDDPLLFSFKSGKALTTRRINQLLKPLFYQASLLLNDSLQSKSLIQASAHWIRHSSFTHQIDAGINPMHVQKNARHSRFETTMRYIHIDEDKRHEANEHWSDIKETVKLP